MNSLHARRAITSVVTMILLIATIIMSTGLLTFGSNMFQTTSQLPSIALSGSTISVNPTDPNGVSWGAIGVRNTGDKIVAVDKIQVRGTGLSFSNWYVESNQTALTIDNFQSKYTINPTDSSGMLQNSHFLSPNSSCIQSNVIKIDFDGVGPKPMLCLQQATGPILLKQGQKAIIYFRTPNGLITPSDSGQSTSLNIYAGIAGGTLKVGITTNQNTINSNAMFVFLVRNQGISDDVSLASIYSKHSKSSDIVTQFSNSLLSTSITNQVAGQKATTYFSLADIQANAANLQAQGYTWIVYDLEPNYSPANEVADPSGSVQQASQYAHTNGLKLMITPAGISPNNFTAMAQYSDGFILQTPYTGDPTTFTNLIDNVVSTIKSGNPNEIIILQDSVNVETIDQMNEAWDLTNDVVNGITIFYGDSTQFPQIAQVLTHVDGIS